MWILTDELCKLDIDVQYGYGQADLKALLHGANGERDTSTNANPLFKVGDTLKETTAVIPLNSLYEELRYYLPFLEAYRRQALESGFSEGFALGGAIRKFLETFSLQYIFIPTPRVKYAGVDDLEGYDETCYYALSPKERASFLIAYDTDDADDDTRYRSGVYLEFEVQTYPDTDKPYIMTKLRFGIDKYATPMRPGFPSDSRFLKGSVMPVRPLLEFFNRVLGVKNSVSNTFKDAFGDEIDIVAELLIAVSKDPGRRDNYSDEHDYSVDSNLLVRGVISDDTHFNENVKFVGTQMDVDDLNRVLTELGIYDLLPLGRINCSIIPDDLWEQTESDSAMRQIMSMNGTEDKYYGCLMPVAWVMSQGVYASSWHMVACMKDWRAFVGTDNFAPVLNKLTVFGAVTTDFATMLVTSAGFLNVTNGTLENPIEVSRLSLDDMFSMCGAGASREDFDEVFAECLEQGNGPSDFTGSVKAGTVDFLLGRVRVLATMYDRNKSLGDYNRRWWHKEYTDGDANKVTTFSKVVYGITPKVLLGTPYMFTAAEKTDLDEKKPLGETEIALFRLVATIDALAGYGEERFKICTRQYGKNNVGVSFDSISESSRAMSICKVPLKV